MSTRTIRMAALAIMTLSTVRVDGLAAQTVNFDYDSRSVRSITVDGHNILTGGGIYLIGSADGSDIRETNFSSGGSNGKRMTNGGPPFSLEFRQSGAHKLAFKASVGPMNVDKMSQLSLAMDFRKDSLDVYEFDGSSYRYWGTRGEFVGSAGRFDDIPQPGVIRDAWGRELGRVGVARIKPPFEWVRAAGVFGTVEIRINRAIGLTRAGFTNHFATDDIGLGMHGALRGATVMVEGEIIVRPNRWTFEAADEFEHESGTAEGESWSCRPGDRANSVMCKGMGVAIASGARVATYTMKTDRVTGKDNAIAKLQVVNLNSGKVMVERKIRPTDFKRPGVEQEFDLPIAAPGVNQPLSFRVVWLGDSYLSHVRTTIK